jgi:hypothetical protein
MKRIKLFEQYISEKISSKSIVTLYDFFVAIQNSPEIEEYKKFIKETGYSSNPYINGYFEDGGMRYNHELIPFKYFNVKGYLKPIYWGSNTSGNIAVKLFGGQQVLNGYVIFGENMGSIQTGGYGTEETFIRPYGKSKDNDSHNEWRYVVSMSTAVKYLDQKYWTKVESSLAFYEYLTLDPSIVNKIKRESKTVLGNFYQEIINRINKDQEFIEWKSKGSLDKKGDAKKEKPLKLEDILKSLETSDYQNRKGNYPKDGIPDSISYWKSTLSFEFKNTDERTGEKWVKNFLSGKNLSPKKISVEQTGDYDNDWISVTTTF